MISKLLAFALCGAATFGIFTVVSSEAEAKGGCLCGVGAPHCLYVSFQQCMSFPPAWHCRWSQYCPAGIAAPTGCREVAKATFPQDSKTRREFRHWCKIH